MGLPFAHCEGGWTLHWTCQQDRVQEESRGHQGASQAVAVGTAGGEDPGAPWGPWAWCEP